MLVFVFGVHYFISLLFYCNHLDEEERAGCFAFILLSFGCLVTVNVLQLLFVVPWVGLQFVIEVFLDHT